MKKDAVTLHCGDCLDVLASLKPNSIDACVTDPPYGLEFMGKDWDRSVPGIEYWKQVFRVLKPGGHILAFGSTRTYHRMACAIEDAGFEIRDCVQWVYGQGFPKSQNVARFIDKELKVKGSLGGARTPAHQHFIDSGKFHTAEKHKGYVRPWMDDPEAVANVGREYIPGSAEARKFYGYGTALKPACEPIVLARKPLSEKTVAANVLRWGTGAINVDGCRVHTDELISNHGETGKSVPTSYALGARVAMQTNGQNLGRWPANLLHDGSEEVVGAFPETTSGALSPGHGSGNSFGVGNDDKKPRAINSYYGNDSGSAARFFYCAKASKKDRAGSKHPTVKPIKLIRYLIRLITPPKGVVLDPFAGTGTTGEAAVLEGARAVLIEREREYVRDIRRRIRKPPAKRGRAIPYDRIAA